MAKVLKKKQLTDDESIFDKVAAYYAEIFYGKHKWNINSFNDLDWPQVYYDNNVMIMVYSPNVHLLYFDPYNTISFLYSKIEQKAGKKYKYRYIDDPKCQLSQYPYCKKSNARSYQFSKYYVMDEERNIYLWFDNEKITTIKKEQRKVIIPNKYPTYFSKIIPDEYKYEMYKLGYLFVATFFLNVKHNRILVTGIDRHNLKHIIDSFAQSLPQWENHIHTYIAKPKTEISKQETYLDIDKSRSVRLLNIEQGDKFDINLHLGANFKYITRVKLVDSDKDEISNFLFDCLYDLVIEYKLFR